MIGCPSACGFEMVLVASDHHASPASTRTQLPRLPLLRRLPCRVRSYDADRADIRCGPIRRYCLPPGGVTHPTVTVVVCHVVSMAGMCAWPPVLLLPCPVTKVGFVGVRCDLNVWLGLTLVSCFSARQPRGAKARMWNVSAVLFCSVLQCLHRRSVRAGSLVGVVITCNE